METCSVLGVLGLIQLVAQRNNQTWRSTNPSSDDLSVFTFNQLLRGQKDTKGGEKVVSTQGETPMCLFLLDVIYMYYIYVYIYIYTYIY